MDSSSEPMPPRSWAPQRAWWVAAAMAVALLFLILFWSLGAERRALSKMREDDRRALYTRQFESLKLMCSVPPVDDALRDRCHDQAEFLGQFPECDGSCRAVIDSILLHPTR